MKRPQIYSREPVPSKPEVVDLLDVLEMVLSDIIRRWQDGVSAEVRAELAERAYEPTLRMLIRLRRRPTPR